MKRSAVGSSLVEQVMNHDQSLTNPSSIGNLRHWAKGKSTSQAKLQDGGFERWTLNGYRTKGLDSLELNGRQSRMM